jgi:uncharacterized delta-60 repeat protein
MKRFKTLFLLLTTLCSLFPALLYSFVDTAWVRRYNGPGNGSDQAYAMAIDNSGNIYVTGRSTGSGTSSDYATIKYNSSGDTVWVRRYNGPGNGSDVARALAVDNSGNVYVAGYSVGSGTFEDYATIKYNSSGDTLWVRRYNGPGNNEDWASAIAVDFSGNVFVTGTSAGDYGTIKYNSNGDTVWVRRYNGPGNNSDQALAIAIDNSGNVYVTGQSIGGTNYDYATIKYNSSGDTVWVRRYNGPGNGEDQGNAIAVDNSGNVYVTGYSSGSGTSVDYATIKYNSSGDTVWVRRYNGPGNGSDVARALAVDNSGNVYVTGYSVGSGTSDDYVTIKYNSSGDTVWVRRYDGNGVDWAASIAVDNSGYVYVTGISDGDYKTIKYNSSGDTVWLTSYNGPGNGSDYALAIAIDNSNNVYISGYSAGSGTGYDYATIKYYQHQYPNDVGCAKIVAPTGVIDSGTVVTPACSVYNYGTMTQSYSVRMKIGVTYNNTVQVFNHACCIPGDIVQIDHLVLCTL